MNVKHKADIVRARNYVEGKIERCYKCRHVRYGQDKADKPCPKCFETTARVRRIREWLQERGRL